MELKKEKKAFVIDTNEMDDGTHDGFRVGDIVITEQTGKSFLTNDEIEHFPFWVIIGKKYTLFKKIISYNENTIYVHSPKYGKSGINTNDVLSLYKVIKHKPHQRDLGIMI